jgi:hypothetical protein
MALIRYVQRPVTSLLFSGIMPSPTGNSVRAKQVVLARLRDIKRVVFVAISLSGVFHIPFKLLFGW